MSAEQTLESALDERLAAEAAADGEGLLIDLDGYEGPLHVLLALARTQKVDLARLSLTKLCDQYLGFIDAAQALRVELAADYLVMAAWLSLIKSRLLLPKEQRHEDEPTEAEIAAHLAHRLRQLELARAAAARLQALPQLERDVFIAGRHKPISVTANAVWRLDVYDLIAAYGRQRMKGFKRRTYAAKPRKAYPIEAARKRLQDLAPRLQDWAPIETLSPRPEVGEDAPAPTSYLASVFGAALELIRDGVLEARQGGQFEPLFLKRRGEGA